MNHHIHTITAALHALADELPTIVAAVDRIVAATHPAPQEKPFVVWDGRTLDTKTEEDSRG